MVNLMLEYSKTILTKVSFDAVLFSKELDKALSTLMPEEAIELKFWLYNFVDDKPELAEQIPNIVNMEMAI